MIGEGAGNMNIFEEIGRLTEKNVGFALLTIIKSSGSTPRRSARMIVLEDGSNIGTIGGGPVEMAATKDAVKCLESCESNVFDYTLNSDIPGALPMHCGGSMSIHIEVFAKRPRVLLCGGGHVNLAVAKLAHDLGFQVAVSDDRESFATKDRFPMAEAIFFNEDIGLAVSEAREQGLADSGTYVVIATKDCDEAALRRIVDSGCPYIGVIGSKRKLMKIRESMINDGFDPALLDSLHWPIGIEIGAETPEEIAVSIMAEILAVRNKASGVPMRREFRDVVKGGGTIG
jgi:xanthine dehydrogenase accessory factor